MRRFMISMLAGLVLVGGVACSSGAGTKAAAPLGTAAPVSTATAFTPSPTPPPPPPAVPHGCVPHGTKLAIGIKSFSFTDNCLAAPKGRPFTVAVTNQKTSFGDHHNLSIYAGPDGADPLFHGDDLVDVGKTVTYHVGALPAGVYYFQCDLHPQEMKGVFVVK